MASGSGRGGTGIGGVRTTAKYEVDALVQDLVAQFSSARLPMPVVVLYAQEDDPELDAEVRSVVRAVQEAQEGGDLPHRTVPHAPDGDPHGNAIAILDGLAKGPWARRGPSWYRGYPAPRSRLVAAIEAATRHVLDDPAGATTAAGAGSAAGPGPAARPFEELVESVLARLRDLHWRPEPRGTGGELQRLLSPVLNSTTLIGAFVLAALTSLLTQASWQLVAAVLLGAVAVLGATGWVRRNTAPLSWLGPASRWFATTTFLAASGRQAAAWSLWRPRMSWDVTQARAREVAGEILKAQLPGTPAEERDRAQQFHLQLRTLALLEDLRWAHRSWAPDARGRKRRVPPVVFVPRADAPGGALRVLGAISDVRSRRSEQDPLLVLAAVAHADVTAWLEDERTVPPGGHSFEPRGGPYESWVSDLRVRQAPSRGRALAWTLPVRLTRQQLQAGGSTRLAPVPVRRSWWFLWSRWSVLLALVLVAAGAGLRVQQLAGQYCEARLVGSNPDAVWRTGPGGTRECVGVATGSVTFAGDGGGVRLSGELPGRDAERTGADVGLGELEEAIRRENARVDALPDVRYVTVVYAGALTTAAGQEGRALNGLKELAGVHLAQVRNNAGDPLKVKVLVANGGQDMYFQTEMVHRIVDLAARDRSIAGVVGLGRDTEDSDAALTLLQQAGLAVVSTTNSASYLARGHVNYFGLAATDQEEAAALRLIVDGLGTPPQDRWAAVLTRTPTPDDRYSPEHARYGSAMLTDAGYRLIGGRPLEYGLNSNGDPDYEQALATTCHGEHPPAVLYLAGRADDVNQLMRRLADDKGCARPLTVLTGDDLTKAQFRTGGTAVAPQATLYYTALSDPAATARGSDLAATAAGVLHLVPRAANPYEDDVFSDGSLALAYDAVAALQAGAAKAGASQLSGTGSVMAALRAVQLNNRPTGTVDFRGAAPLATDPLPGHGLHVIRVRRDAQGAPVVDHLCGRPAGETAPLTGCAP
ncbi:hypothetical protein Kpho02_20560 [Kitasatospora phosalacinea]|uniref:Uncharacterized protein n=1 Tax=Kitasatospora phosalacinea TaxID=2065 RepID=A0A9W6Q4N6_9ACTN|nr:hypothetical protein Kpho02_20560 [Kitasatospora phosalacinea]